MSDNYWQTDVTWAPPADGETAGPGGWPRTAAGPDWVIPPPAGGGGGPSGMGGGGGSPSRPTLIALIAGIVVTLVLGFVGAGLALNTDRATPSADSGRSTAPTTTTPVPGGVTVADLDLTAIAAKVDPSVVDIASTLGYQNGAAAGTGIVLTSSGQVLTNNHVIDGATSITATVVATGRTYTAKVVGTDPTEDIAVIQLADASGLATANVGDSTSVQVGATVIGVGNVEGAGGAATAATGKVLALNQSITASDEGGGNSETLSDVIVSDAPIEPGDSGGPLYDSSNHIIGIDTAANTSGATQAFSIPIDHAVTIAQEIEDGVPSTTIHIGYPGFLGVSIGNSQAGTGAPVVGTVQGGAAATAGIVAGDTITRINATAVTTPASLQTVMAGLRPGAKVTVGYLDAAGTAHAATLTLTTGPAD